MEGGSALTICIGDIHGHIEKLKKLWKNLETSVGTAEFLCSTVIFLGDYNDRGPDTKSVLDFLTSLPERYPSQTHVFITGNHDFAFMACLGILPTEPPPGYSYSRTWAEYAENEEREGWWSGHGQEDVHVQGRRWAGTMKSKFNLAKGILVKDSTYDSASTFASYGVAHGDRFGLIAAVPNSHKQFLRSLVWVHEQDGVKTDDPAASYSKLIAVHAGLDRANPVESQLAALRSRDGTVPRIEALSGRKNVWDNPKELADKRVLLVSGHHGALSVDKLRLIIDEGGGLAERPIAAIVLPSRMIVRDTDDLTEQNASLLLPRLKALSLA